MTPEEQLRARPSFEQGDRDYLAMLDRMRATLSAIVPALSWETPAARQEGRSFCPEPFTDVAGAEKANYDSGDASGSIPDADWDRAVAAVAELARPYGFTQVRRLLDKPGNHDVAIEGPWGQSVHLGTAADTVLYVQGPCLLHDHAPSTSAAPSTTGVPLAPAPSANPGMP